MNAIANVRASAAGRRRLAAAVLAAALPVLGGCAGLYFRDAGPAAPVQYETASLPFGEYWTGIVFNGEKIGFSRFTIRQGSLPGRHEIRSEASFALRFLGIEKKIHLKARDAIASDLTLIEFAYDYHIDGSDLKVAGRREGGELVATVVSGGRPTEQRLPVDGRLYPSSVIALYPVVHGLAVGREYGYRVYNGETQAILEVNQRVAAYQSSELFTGAAFKVETAMRGHRVTTWIGRDGRLVFELALHGVMINALEDAGSAKRYLLPSVTVQSNDPSIRRLAGEIVAGIPTRVVNGLVYSQELGGFLYHSWAESLVGARWAAVDPTFGQAAADATHIKLLEGEALADLAAARLGGEAGDTRARRRALARVFTAGKVYGTAVVAL